MRPGQATRRRISWAWVAWVGLASTLVLSGAFSSALANAEGPDSVADDGRRRDRLMGAQPLDTLRWSATIFGELDGIHSDQDDDGIGGFFDQYDYTPNKSPGVGLQVGVREASLDWIENRTPLLQLRFESPSANLGVTGDDVDNAFLNQRALVLGRTDAFQIDGRYRRFRTEQLRLFPETDAGGGALPFTDLTSRNDRFYRERTGFLSEVRWRPDVSLDPARVERSRFEPEIALRGGWERRETQRQLPTLLDRRNNWLSFSDERGDDVSDVGTGVLVVPVAGLTVTLDYDYQKFEADNAIQDTALPFASIDRSVDFVPSTERHTAQVFAHARIKDRAVVTAGFQATLLEQNSPETPAQRSANFGENEVQAYTAQLTGELRLSDALSAGTTFKYAYRNHDLDRSGPLFDPTNGSQVDEFLETYERIDAELELRYRVSRKARFAAGLRVLWIDRDLDFPVLGLANPVIQPQNALVEDETQMWTVFVRGDVRPLPTLGIRAELSFRSSPETGYVTDLDNYFQGELRGTYSLPLRRPATLSLFLRGGLGENTDFSMVDGLAPSPPGPVLDRDYERSHLTVGGTGDWAWREDVTLFGSLFYSWDRQGDDLQLSNLQRYFQEVVPITFRRDGRLDFHSDEVSLVLGSQISISKRTDAGLSYSYTRAVANYDTGNSRAVGLIDANREVDANIHAAHLELRHRLRDGLRVFVGYGIQYYSDGAPKPSTSGSVRSFPDRSDLRHTLSFGVTLNGDLFARR